MGSQDGAVPGDPQVVEFEEPKFRRRVGNGGEEFLERPFVAPVRHS